MTRLFIDADACPVKDECYRVALRYGVKVFLVANGPLRVPAGGEVELVVVSDGFDAADNWIAEQIGTTDIAVTNDIPLAKRCLDRQALVVTPTGHEYDGRNIGSALASRALMQDLREIARAENQFLRGPGTFSKADRSRFLQVLDRLMVQARRKPVRPPAAPERPAAQETPPAPETPGSA
jgi:uncharacterized protein